MSAGNGIDLAGDPVLALIDFSNVEPGASSDEILLDALELVADLIRRVLVAAPVAVLARDVLQVDCRLYDGWIDRSGGHMEKYRRVQRLLPQFAGLEHGVRIVPRLVTSMACLPSAELVGTYKNGGQKMVDQMLAQDAHYFAASDDYGTILLMANDDDYVPVVLASAVRYGKPIRWLRKRAAAFNDVHFDGLRVDLLVDPAWTPQRSDQEEV